VVDEAENMNIKLKTHSTRMEVNDELIQYLQEHEDIRYSLEVA